MVTRSRKGARGLPLPWERRGEWARRVLAGPRWKIALLFVALALGVFLLFRAAERQARRRETRAAIAEVHRAISAFRSDVGRCPRSSDELVHPPRTGTRYLRALPVDGWGRELWIRCPARTDPDSAEVVSAGPSGSFFVDDNLR